MATNNHNPDSDSTQQNIPIADALRITEIVQALDAWWEEVARVRLKDIIPVVNRPDDDYVITVTFQKGYHKPRPVSIAIRLDDPLSAAVQQLQIALEGGAK